ncbi:MAG: nitrite/sulfite reductase [Magnetovibrio sp.]|nr:nitrite/sulfite reductase [Magnetovibrio sp.]
MTFERPANDFVDFDNQTLASNDDIAEFRAGIAHYISGDWHDDRWKTFRLRFGIYEQRQAGEHMMRVKLPGGRMSLEQARTIARSNAAHGGGDIHITTRQGIQLYFIALKNLAPFVEQLNTGGVSTREASGNTFRAITACPKAGFCGSELTDAAQTAGKLTRAWLRHPLTQHMPRKFKTTVSGCATDCGLSSIDDLGFIAVERDGQKGFRVVAGGGLGTHPSIAVELFEFVSEDELPGVQEAVARVHVAHSSRENKNRARIKFLVKRFGEQEFVRLVHEQYALIRNFERRSWAELDWNEAGGDAGELRLRGPIAQPSKHTAVGIEVPLGWLTSGQLENLADLAEASGATELRLTRDQNIVAVGLNAGSVELFIEATRNLGLDASGRKHAMDNLVSCPGTYTCAIGITDSHALAESLLDAGPEFDGLPNLKLRVSGCHNSCGHHHLGDIGLHGIAKKIDGKPAPHYQVHLGGSPKQHGITGPFIPAKRAKQTLLLLLEAIKVGKADDESVRQWAERVGSHGIVEILAPVLKAEDAKAAFLRFDVADDNIFVPPVTSTGECAAGSVVGEHLSDLARVARQDVLRAERVENREQAVIHVHEALVLPAQRLLTIAGGNEAQPVEQLAADIRQQWPHNKDLLNALNSAVVVEAAVLSGGQPSDALPALQAWA